MCSAVGQVGGKRRARARCIRRKGRMVVVGPVIVVVANGRTRERWHRLPTVLALGHLGQAGRHHSNAVALR